MEGNEGVSSPMYHYTDRLSLRDIRRDRRIRAYPLTLYGDMFGTAALGTTPPIVWLTTAEQWEETVARKLQHAGWPYPPYGHLRRIRVHPGDAVTLEEFSASAGIPPEHWRWVLASAALAGADWTSWRVVARDIPAAEWLGVERLTNSGEWRPTAAR